MEVTINASINGINASINGITNQMGKSAEK
jgi:hypothetical protein